MRPLPGLLAVLALMSAAPVSLAQGTDHPEAAPRPPLAISTHDFLLQAAAANKFEIASSQLALRKTQSSAVHGFAHQVINDYSAAGMKFRQAVADAKLPPPREALDATHQALLDGLAHTPPGKTLSRAYLEAQENALRDDLAVFQAYAQRGDNERLRLFAEEMAPVMQSHLDQLGKLRR